MNTYSSNTFQEFNFSNKLKDDNILFNWSKTNPLACLHQVLYPKDEQDLVDILKQNSKSKIRVVGTGLSYEPIHSIFSEDSDAILLNLKCFQGIVSFNNNSVTFRAGTQLDTIYKYLIDNGKMLPASPGVIGIQTIAGAISTGTHGQGMNQSSLCEVVLALKIVLSDGNIEVIDETNDHFGAFIMSLGCLGIITEVTLRTVPNQIMTCKKITTNYENLCCLFTEMNLNSRFSKAWWFSWTDEVVIWQVNDATDQEIDIYNKRNQQLTCISSTIDNKMNDTIDKAAVKIGYETKDLEYNGKHFETITRFKSTTDVTGNVYQILCKGIPAPQINCEIAVPFDQMVEVLNELCHWQKITETTLHYPFILRCTGPSKAWLNPAYSQNVCYIGFLVYLAKDGSFIDKSFDMMKEIQKILAKNKGIPHFGKHFVYDLYNFHELLPKWKDFIALKKKLDPNGRFENSYITNLFKENIDNNQGHNENKIMNKEEQHPDEISKLKKVKDFSKQECKESEESAETANSQDDTEESESGDLIN